MSYIKKISFGEFVEIYEYEKDLRYFGRKNKKFSFTDPMQGMGETVEDQAFQNKQKQKKRIDNVRRTSMAFKRLISANLGESTNPLLVTLTHSENIEDIGIGYSNFKTFISNLRDKFGKSFRYLAVPEFQKRGAIHFHVMFFGLDTKQLAESERRTRLFAFAWGKGFVDLIATDGSQKLIGYLSKYMAKSFVDERLKSKKAYVASRNIVRPVVEKNPLLLPLFFGGLDIVGDLSTADLLREKEFDTQWLGKGRYRIFKINP